MNFQSIVTQLTSQANKSEIILDKAVSVEVSSLLQSTIGKDSLTIQRLNSYSELQFFNLNETETEISILGQASLLGITDVKAEVIAKFIKTSDTRSEFTLEVIKLPPNWKPSSSFKNLPSYCKYTFPEDDTTPVSVSISQNSFLDELDLTGV